jgi:hypothetical protein
MMRKTPKMRSEHKRVHVIKSVYAYARIIGEVVNV